MTEQTVFNAQNTGYETKKYPLFFGESLGIYDTVNVAYPEIAALYEKQMSQIWNESEISLVQDRQDMLTQSKDTVDLMVKTISWQMIGDSIASKSVSGLLLRHITNSELEGMVNAWALFESIHARAYSHIVKQTFTDPNKMLEDTYKNTQTIIRSEAIIKAFNDLDRVAYDAPRSEVEPKLICAITALYALEAIAFMSSFAVTFAITETDVFQGIAKEVTLIARDEALHSRMGYAMLKIMKDDKESALAMDKCKGDMKTILDSIVLQEMAWADYLFSEGRQVVGLTSELLKEYTQYMAYPVYRSLGIDYDFERIAENPCSYMDTYIDSTQMQVAPQELQISSYLVGAIRDDTDGLDLDFDL